MTCFRRFQGNVAGWPLLAGATILAGLAVSAATPARAADDSNITVGLIVKDLQVPFWLDMRKQALEEAAAKHVKLLFVAGRYAGDVIAHPPAEISP
jgi:ABC-type sugar transport system substrate-binding protein